MPVNVTRTPAFYEENYIPEIMARPQVDGVNLSDPTAIYRFLIDNVYKQDEICKAAAMILYQHVQGNTTCNFICGPAGSGKTLVMESIRKIWPRTVIINAATLTKEGFKGENKVHSFLENLPMGNQDYIVCFDEADKAIAHNFTSSGDNVSARIQSELLKLVEGELVPVQQNNKTIQVDTRKMTFVFCGSFAEKARSIAAKERDKVSRFGFLSTTNVEEPKAFDRELTIDDLIDFGLIPELASRATRLLNIRPLNIEDYTYLIKEHPASPLKKLARKNNITLRISDAKLRMIAEEAYISGLGVRKITSQLQQLIDKLIFESYLRNSSKPTELDL